MECESNCSPDESPCGELLGDGRISGNLRRLSSPSMPYFDSAEISSDGLVTSLSTIQLLKGDEAKASMGLRRSNVRNSSLANFAPPGVRDSFRKRSFSYTAPADSAKRYV